MVNGKTFLAIIPARSGSKGLPNKNVRPFLGEPLLARAARVALESGVFETVFVSTDSEAYAEIARGAGAEAPFLRPARISGDAAAPDDYIRHALDGLARLGKSFDYFAVLQPTSPLREARHIQAAARLAAGEGLASVVSFSPSEHAMNLYHALPRDLRLGGVFVGKDASRQAQTPYYRINGMVYIAETRGYLNGGSFYSDGGKAVIFERESAIDIDTEFDFALAEFIAKRLGGAE